MFCVMQTSDTEPMLLHIAVAAKRLGLSQHQVRHLVNDGTLPHQKVANRTYIPVRAIEEYVGAAS